MSRGAVVELEVMVTAELPTPHGYVYRAEGNPVTRLAAGLNPRGDTVLCPCLAYAVRHPTAGTILIDTGMHPDVHQSLRRDFGAPMSMLFRSMKPAERPYDDQLRALGIEPAEVRQVVMTHLHVDHTSGMRLLPEAEFVCAAEEWEATSQRFAAGKGYVGHHLPPRSRVRLVDFAAEGEPYGPFARTIDLLGDGSIRLISTPGHTPGHLSVLLQTTGRPVLVIGDAAYTLRNVFEGILPMITTDDGASRRSMAEIAEFARAEPEAILVPTHDPEAWHGLRHVSASAREALAGTA